MTPSKNPAFNLKAVLQETGIAADTLRAWERRYGLPLPQRTAGGHRLYSQHDIETIKWLLARQAEGLSISRAVDMWNEKSASGVDLLAVLPIHASTTPVQATAYLPPETSLDALRSHWLAACLNFNEIEAEQALNQAFAMYPVETVCTEVLQKGLSEVGSQWYENRASVQQEHFASALAMRRLDTLLGASPAPTREETILVGCPANEWHTFTPLLISLFLRRRGFNVIYLGANVPSDRFEETVKSVHAKLVLLVAQQLITAATLIETSLLLSAKNITVGFGGRVFNIHRNLIKRVAGHFLGNSVEDAVGQVESIIINETSSNPEPEANTQEYFTASHAFSSRRPHIEATLNQSIGLLGYGTETMKTATEFLGNNIAAALQLGNVRLVDTELDWVRSMLKSQHIPDSALSDYMKTYADAVNLNINGSGKPIIEWLKQF